MRAAHAGAPAASGLPAPHGTWASWRVDGHARPPPRPGQLGLGAAAQDQDPGLSSASWSDLGPQFPSENI